MLVGAGGQVLGQGFNQPIHERGSHRPRRGGGAARAAARALGNYRLGGTTLYVTVEPCLMCVGALVNARVGTVVYGVAEPKWGALRLDPARSQDLQLNHRFHGGPACWRTSAGGSWWTSSSTAAARPDLK